MNWRKKVNSFTHSIKYNGANDVQICLSYLKDHVNICLLKIKLSYYWLANNVFSTEVKLLETVLEEVTDVNVTQHNRHAENGFLYTVNAEGHDLVAISYGRTSRRLRGGVGVLQYAFIRFYYWVASGSVVMTQSGWYGSEMKRGGN